MGYALCNSWITFMETILRNLLLSKVWFLRAGMWCCSWTWGLRFAVYSWGKKLKFCCVWRFTKSKKTLLLSKSTLQEQFRVHYGAPRDFRRYNLAVCLKMSQRLHEEHDMLLTFHTYAISLQNIITCSWKLAMLINQPWAFDVPENIEMHTRIEEFCGNAMEN